MNEEGMNFQSSTAFITVLKNKPPAIFIQEITVVFLYEKKIIKIKALIVNLYNNNSVLYGT